MNMRLFAVLLLGVLVSASAHAADGDVAKGAVIYKTKCGMCHAPDQNRVGPKSNNVVGRKAGSLPDYNYSAALKASGLVWDVATLQKWLSSPAALVTGTKMAFKLDNPQDRDDVIAYLKTLTTK